MNRLWMTAALLLGLVAFAFAQTSSSAQTTLPQGSPGATRPGMSTGGTPPTFPPDKEAPPPAADTQSSTTNSQSGSSSSSTSTTQSAPSASTTQTAPDQSATQTPDKDSDQHQPGGNSGSLHDSANDQKPISAGSGNDLAAQIQSAMRNQQGLSNVNVVVNEDRVDLLGSVANSKDKNAAESIAQSFANGRKVVDHISVSGK